MTDRKNIFVTGAASGIGRETARFFARQGWFVGIFDVNEEGLRALQSEIGENNCCLGRMDVTDPESVKKSVEAFTEQTGGRMGAVQQCRHHSHGAE